MTMSGDYDGIVVGSGHNALVCALNLAHAGWRILVLERSDEVGGGMRTKELTLPGFKHDLFATNVGRFALSPTYRKFQPQFEEIGIRFVTNTSPYASVYGGGRTVRAYSDRGKFEREVERVAPRDLPAWRVARDFFDRTAPKFQPLTQMMAPSFDMMRQFARIWANPADAIRLTGLLMQSARQFVDGFFRSDEMKGLFAPWSFHSDFGPDVAGGGVYTFITSLSAMRGQTIVEGGAGRLSEAMRTLIEQQGGKVITGAEVKHVRVENRRAVAVETGDGEVISARRAIVASVTPRSLFGRLVRDEDIPAGFRRRVRAFRYGGATFVLHLALRNRLQWRASEDLSDFNTVHIGGGLADLTLTHEETSTGKIPSRPLLIVSQTSHTDPTRTPNGEHIVRIHSRSFPPAIRGDGAGAITARDWDGAREAVAERLIDILSEYVPNVRTDLLARHAVSPLDLERQNPNWVGGDCSSGSHEFRQNYFFRPVAGWSRYRTPISNLYMIGSSTWPGGGIHGTSGYLVAQELLR
jgi:phytoene dehydrogenase-like protein